MTQQVQVQVHVQQALDLVNTPCSSFAKIHYLNSQGKKIKTFETTVLSQAQHPSWDQVFSLPFDRKLIYTSFSGIKVTIWEKRLFRRNKFLGQVTIKVNVEALFNGTSISGSFPLQQRKSSETVQGYLFLVIQELGYSKEVSSDDHRVPKHENDIVLREVEEKTDLKVSSQWGSKDGKLLKTSHVLIPEDLEEEDLEISPELFDGVSVLASFAPDLARNIFKFLPLDSLFAASCVSKNWHTSAEDQELWKFHFMQKQSGAFNVKKCDDWKQLCCTTFCKPNKILKHSVTFHPKSTIDHFTHTKKSSGRDFLKESTMSIYSDGLYASDYDDEEYTAWETDTEHHAEYIILSPKDLLQRQQSGIHKVREVLDVHEPTARTLLMHFHWNIEAVLQQYFEEGKEAVYKSAGIGLGQIDDFQGDFTCPLCYEDVGADDTTQLSCGHRFCNECWSTYITMKVNEGHSRQLYCMGRLENGRLCTVLFEDWKMPAFVDDTTREKYAKVLLDSYVDDNPYAKWCPSAPHCGNCVAVSSLAKPSEVYCLCGKHFCFQCGEDAHTPAGCKMKDEWNITENGANANYIYQNCKPCPKCNKLIEKDGGCLLVTCTCGQYFCWLCGAPTGFAHNWERIEGHECGKYKKSVGTSDTDADSFGRYIHYHERFEAHQNNTALAQKVREDVSDIKAFLQEKGTGSEFWYVGLDSAVEIMIQARHYVARSYIAGFCLFSPKLSPNVSRKELSIHQSLFEDHQAQLEGTLEILNKWIETPKTEIDISVLERIKKLGDLVASRVKAFNDIIQQFLADASYDYKIAEFGIYKGQM